TNLSQSPDFLAVTSTLSAADLEQKANEELVLRFFAAKNYRGKFKGSVRDWLDDYMESILLGFEDFDESKENEDFRATFEIVASSLGDTAFVKFRNGAPIG